MDKEEEVIKMNKWLEKVKKYPFCEISGKEFPEYLSDNVVYYKLDEKKVAFRVWIKENEKRSFRKRSFMFNNDVTRTGSSAYIQMQKVYKIPNLSQVYLDRDKKVLNPNYMTESFNFEPFFNPLLNYFNKKYGDEVIRHVHYYDINAAYAGIIMGKIPDFSRIRRKRPDYECVAFDDTGRVVDVDDPRATFWFPFRDSPYIDACLRWRKRKDMKYIYTLGIGYMANKFTRPNCLMFNWVVDELTKIIKNVIKDKFESIIRIWVDGIYSAEPLPCKIGKEIGEWKYEKRLAQFRNISYFRTDLKVYPATKDILYKFDNDKKEIVYENNHSKTDEKNEHN